MNAVKHLVGLVLVVLGVIGIVTVLSPVVTGLTLAGLGVASAWGTLVLSGVLGLVGFAVLDA